MLTTNFSHYLFFKEERYWPKIPLTACWNSTIAEALVRLLRQLHSLPAWTEVINIQLVCDNESNYAAALAFLGGVTDKPRIGGNAVTHDGNHGSFSIPH